MHKQQSLIFQHRAGRRHTDSTKRLVETRQGKHVQGEMMEIHETHLDSMNTINTRETRSREAHGEQNTHRQSMGMTIML